jgi:UDP-N-acetylglucosamine 2-epimerase (non-hydrolysing)
MKVILVAGARPNFMKIAPLIHASGVAKDLQCLLVHTGQHYDYAMSKAFFIDLGIPEPDYFLEAGSGTHAVQTAKVMVEFEKICAKVNPDLVIVVGDVNSTLACSIVAKKLMIQVAHVEAGLRSFDLSMPEEINRMVTDSIADLFFVTEEEGRANLLREGKDESRIHSVGHVMIDNLLYQLKTLEEFDCTAFETHDLKKRIGPYLFLTLHRPSNVDSKETFEGISSALNEIAEEYHILFPVHPRTRKQIDSFNIELSPKIIQLQPLAFRESLFLWKDSVMVITDSGGLQEETTALKKPCITLRNNTERPITVECGSNVLAGNSKKSIMSTYRNVLDSRSATYGIPPLWDGKASERIWRIVERSLRKTNLFLINP